MPTRDGIADQEDLLTVTPPTERLAKGPVVVIECFQQIPCDPCYSACRRGAIQPFCNLVDLPQVDYDKCDGCGACISSCPGLAIFVVHDRFHEEESLVKLPYERLPLPGPGDIVEGLDREGRPVCRARVERVQNARVQDHTPVFWLAVPRGLGMTVRSLRPVAGSGST